MPHCLINSDLCWRTEQMNGDDHAWQLNRWWLSPIHETKYWSKCTNLKPLRSERGFNTTSSFGNTADSLAHSNSSHSISFSVAPFSPALYSMWVVSAGFGEYWSTQPTKFDCGRQTWWECGTDFSPRLLGKADLLSQGKWIWNLKLAEAVRSNLSATCLWVSLFGKTSI